MTKEQFEKYRFGAKDRFMYKGIIYSLVSVDFDEYLIGLDDSCELRWVRCENVELLTNLKK